MIVKQQEGRMPLEAPGSSSINKFNFNFIGMNLLKIGSLLFLSLLLVGCGNISRDVNKRPSATISSDGTEISKGSYTYKLKKKNSLRKEKFIVCELNNFSIDESKHEPAPEDDYIINFTVIPKSDASAVRGFRNFKEGEMKITTDQDMKNAQQLMKDVGHMENVKFSVAIFPTNDSIGKNVIKIIGVGSEITVSGIHFEHVEVFKNGSKETLPVCLQRMDVIFATEFSVY